MRDSRCVLLVEDDSIDAMTVRRAFRDLRMTNPLRHVTNGEEALAYLQDPSNDRPCVILLDLNMPRMNGIEFLKITKTDAGLRRIPVVVLTTSSEERDVVQSFRLNVAGYIIKPVDYRNFVEAIRTINLYWTLSQLPEEKVESPNAACQTSVAG